MENAEMATVLKNAGWRKIDGLNPVREAAWKDPKGGRFRLKDAFERQLKRQPDAKTSGKISQKKKEHGEVPSPKE